MFSWFGFSGREIGIASRASSRFYLLLRTAALLKCFPQPHYHALALLAFYKYDVDSILIMSAGVIGAEKRSLERAHQACLNCRRKKARCNGEKPVCRTCAQAFLNCRWAVDSAPGFKARATALRNETLATRISMLEQQLKSIASGVLDKDGTIAAKAEVNLNPVRATRRANISSTAVVPITPNDPIQLPSQSMFADIMDNFFKYCHNQPYSYFRERTFRRQYSDRELPVYLLYAFAATAIRFSPLFSTGSDRFKLVQPYCDISWTQLTQYTFHPPSELDITLVQTSSLLSVIDFICRLSLSLQLTVLILFRWPS